MGMHRIRLTTFLHRKSEQFHLLLQFQYVPRNCNCIHFSSVTQIQLRIHNNSFSTSLPQLCIACTGDTNTAPHSSLWLLNIVTATMYSKVLSAIIQSYCFKASSSAKCVKLDRRLLLNTREYILRQPPSWHDVHVQQLSMVTFIYLAYLLGKINTGNWPNLKENEKSLRTCHFL